jgi:hypothetical protein
VDDGAMAGGTGSLVVSHRGLAIYIKKYLQAKRRRIYGNSIFFTMPKYNLQKIL